MKKSKILITLMLTVLLASFVNIPVALADDYPAPTGLKLTVLGSSEIKLSWNAQDTSESAYYDIYEGTSASNIKIVYSIECVSGHSYVFSHLYSNTTYYFAVGACPWEGNASKPCTPKSAKTANGIKYPSTIQVSSVSESSIRLHWTPVSGAYNYSVYMSDTTLHNDYHFVAFTDNLSYTVTNLPDDRLLYYVVRAVSSKGEGNMSNVLGCWTRTKAPSNLKAKALSTTSIKLTWNPYDFVLKYAVYRYDASLNEYKRIAYVSPGTSPSFTDKNLKPGVTYKYAVDAINVGGASKFSKVSAKTLAQVQNP